MFTAKISALQNRNSKTHLTANERTPLNTPQKREQKATPNSKVRTEPLQNQSCENRKVATEKSKRTSEPKFSNCSSKGISAKSKSEPRREFSSTAKTSALRNCKTWTGVPKAKPKIPPTSRAPRGRLPNLRNSTQKSAACGRAFPKPQRLKPLLPIPQPRLP